MSVPMPVWTTAHLAKLERAYALGASSVVHEGKNVKFRSRVEMKAIIDELRNAIGTAAGVKRVRSALAGFDRGHR